MKLQQKPVNIGPYIAREFSLENSSGLSVSFLNYGGIITKFITPDKTANMANIVLCAEDYDDYRKNFPFSASIIGRTSGYIYTGCLNINGQSIYLSKNAGIHHKDGGFNNLSNTLFDYDIDIKNEQITIALSAKLKAENDGYPGNADISVFFSLDESNNFKIKYEAKVDEDSLINLSHRTYFNLSGDDKSDILSHLLFIPSDYTYAADEQLFLTGELKPVSGTPFDFNGLSEIGKKINSDCSEIKNANGYDHYFLLKKNGSYPTITLYEPLSMRSLNITTNQNVLHFDSQNISLGKPAKETVSDEFAKFKPHHGACLQFQSPPIGLNECFLNASLVKKNQLYEKYTNYFFKLI